MSAVEIREPDVVQAKCEACGHNWKYRRHEALVCPYCSNSPKDVTFKHGYMTLSDEISRRWFA